MEGQLNNQPCTDTLEAAQLLTAAQVAQKLGVAQRTVWRWKRDGLISFVQPAGQGGAIRFPSDSLQARPLPSRQLVVTKPSPNLVAPKRLSGPVPRWMTDGAESNNHK